MSDLVSIASGAVSIYQRALATVSNNIANVDTEGYTRQELDQKENNTRQYGTSFFGTGAYLAGVERQYDAFAENNLRRSYSDLEVQTSILEFTNRVVDLLGDEDIGLLSAFDKFFAAAKQLSTDPASNIMRNAFLSDSDGLAAQFRNLSAQLDLVEKETEEGIKAELRKINSITDQLATVNKQLSRKSTTNDQPPEILDTRDLLLRELSQLVRNTVTEKTSGVVTVSLGTNSNQGVILSGVNARNLEATIDSSDVGRVVFNIDPQSASREVASGVGGGTLGGIVEVRKKVLKTVYSELDTLAKSFASEVNKVHKEGLDGYGNPGGDLFALDPKFTITAATGQTAVQSTISVNDISKVSYGNINLSYDQSAGQVSNIQLGNENFSDGDKILFSLNGKTVTYTVEAGIGSNREQLMGSITKFLKDAFGTQIIVRQGTQSDFAVSSQLLRNFTFSAVTDSSSGHVSQTNHAGLWTATDSANNSTTGISVLDINGLRITLTGKAKDGENLILNSVNRPAAGLKVALTDPKKIAAAAQFRVIESALNVGGVIANLNYQKPNIVPSNIKEIDTLLTNNLNATAGVAVDGTSSLPTMQIQGGKKTVQLALENFSASNPLELQVLTTDGRHLVGRKLGDDLISTAKTEALKADRVVGQSEIEALVQQAGQTMIDNVAEKGGFEKGATYSSNYLNGFGDTKYKNLEVFYGFKGRQLTTPNYDVANHLLLTNDPVSAKLQFGAIAPDSKGVIVSQDGLTLNGEPLKPLTHFGVTSTTSGYSIDPNTTFFNAGTSTIKVSSENGVLKYQLNFPGAIIDGGVVTTDPVSGIKTLTFSDTEGKYKDFKISYAGTLNDGDTVQFTTAALTGDNLTNHVLSWLNSQQNAYGKGLLSSLGITAQIVDGDKSTAAIDKRIELVRSVQPNKEQISISGSYAADSTTINSGNAMNINITARGITHTVAVTAANTKPTGVVASINAANVGVRASFDYTTKKINLVGTAGKENSFELSVKDNASGNTVSDLTFTSSQSASSNDSKNAEPSDILFGFGEKGTSAELSRFGLRTSAYIESEIKEDLLVFVTGAGTGKLNAAYESTEFDQTASLRKEPFEITFDTETEYTIKDVNTGTTLASRKYNALDGINYQGVKVNLSANPSAGDTFLIDGDDDGIGNNQNILNIAALEQKGFVGGENGATLSESYGGAVTKVGNIANQANISQQALTIVNEQALEKRDQVSGVSLDEEAADLVRFQQAYQASARVMQVSNQLFDSILQLR
ncbi:MAG: flagellar hook-associated protein FlgK [Proteobacteria bacterium]|nr:flagellar hook-associated protein FlgK [Pseudomonadota bacterium]